ncbi:MAG TPA: carbamoyltransferase C-terminal domain-containing protein [Vicinamibacterales bacterium]|nr:carbamoyltransferase C-terminal domain-containing protein [Vicinamibacterales bacterium]
MKVLGISGRDRDAAAALAVDGRVVAAATEDSFARVAGIGYALTGGFPRAAAQACLDVAGLDAADIDEVSVVNDTGAAAGAQRARGFERVPVRVVDPARADAAHAVMSDPAATAVVVCSAHPPLLAAFAHHGDGLGPRVDIPGADRLVAGATGLAAVLGISGDDPFAALDRLSVGAEPEFQADMAQVLLWREADGVALESSALSDVARRVAGEFAGGLSDPLSLNARVQRTRRALAASFTSVLAGVVARVADGVGSEYGSGPIGVGGSVFANARFNTELMRLLGSSVSFPGVPEACGRALGALNAKAGDSRSGLALGPVFSEEDIKRVLDNCRLDYVYEPDWTRLLSRVSRMLAQGKIVGWFQGAMPFGPRALGMRSILADPSHRYARQNLNEYLRQAPLDEPLPVVLAPSVAHQCLAEDAVRHQGVLDARIRPEWRQSLAAALDWRQAVRVHGVTPAPASHLGDLLELHHAATGTPGLIEANLAGPGEPVACTPRDAVRTVYSSAIDALVIGRFLLMKDYWLLRTTDS